MKRISLVILLSICIANIIPQWVWGEEEKFNYVDAFAKSILFYEANWCDLMQGTTELNGVVHVMWKMEKMWGLI